MPAFFAHFLLSVFSHCKAVAQSLGWNGSFGNWLKCQAYNLFCTWIQKHSPPLLDPEERGKGQEVHYLQCFTVLEGIRLLAIGVIAGYLRSHLLKMQSDHLRNGMWGWYFWYINSIVLDTFIVTLVTDLLTA